MQNQDSLRQRVTRLKETEGISYRKMMEIINYRNASYFSRWLAGVNKYYLYLPDDICNSLDKFLESKEY
jgi:hypothetical protein